MPQLFLFWDGVEPYAINIKIFIPHGNLLIAERHVPLARELREAAPAPP